MLLQSLLRPVLTPIMRGIFDAAQSVSAAWSPLSLWPDGILSPGMWISPRDLTSQWQDSAGTTPVSVPGTVADSSNPVGLAYDLRAGTPVLGPQLITGTPAWMQANWTDNGGRSYASDGSGYLQFAGVTPGASYEVTFDIADYVTGGFCVNLKTAWDAILSAAGSYSYIVVDATNISFYASGLTATINNLSVKEVPGNHMLQSTSAARPLMSARVNLLTYTEDFSNAVWGTYVFSGSPTLVKTPDYATAPDASMTACRVQCDAMGGNGVVLYQAPVIAGTYPKSVWIKSNTGSDQVITITAAEPSAKITVTSTWARYSCAANIGPHYAFQVGVYLPDGTDSSCDILIWHPQVELGTTATDYQSVPGNGSTYATDFPIFQLYDGVDDGMATAAFSAGTLTDARWIA
jgi:hypothetical protein